MSTNDGSEGYNPRFEDLERIESLDFSEKNQRRIGTLLLEEFVRTTLHGNGVSYLEFHNGSENQDLKTLWGNTLALLKELEDFELPENFDGAMTEIKAYRNKTSHGNVFDPPASRLEQLVEICYDWIEWLSERSEEYRNSDTNPTPQEALLRIARENLYPVTSIDATVWYTEDEMRDLKAQAAEIESKIESMIEEEDEVSTELVNEISTAISLRNSYEDLLEENGEEAERRHRDLQVSAHLEEYRIERSR